MVEETLEAGASVARVALRHGVNSHQVFQWRKLYREGRLGERGMAGATLLPVRVAEPSSAAAGAREAERQRAAYGAICVELPKGQLRITGRVDAQTLRVVLEQLLG
jgi:transposase